MSVKDQSEEVVFVTGATSGFGEAIARRYASAGARVILTGRREPTLARLAGELGERAHPLPLDVRDRAAVVAAFGDLPAAFAGVTILVNNAGLGIDRAKAQDASLDDWEVMVDTNIKGVLFCTRAALPGMLARGRGHIVNIGSVAGRANGPGGAVYSASKAFVLHFSKNLKTDLIATPVRCAYIAPGAAETEFSLVRFEGDADRAAAAYRGYEALTAEDVAEAVVFATSMPPHVDVTELELMPHRQGFGPRIFDRDG